MDESLEFTLGRHEALLNTLDSRTKEIESGVHTIAQSLAEKRGERRMLLLASGAVSTGVALLFEGIRLVFQAKK